ncbi:MAG: hypothetical protein KJ955_04800 [Nanoarchaeota archaeon]|nr:hypothetical protein [Nanoarchaeota archaeon]
MPKQIEEGKLAHQYRDAFDARRELYKLMKRVALATGLGEEEDDYTETLCLDIGGGTLSYDPYYDKLSFEKEDSEYEIEQDDLKTAQKLIKEITARFEVFKETAGASQIAGKIFGKPLRLE